MELGALDVLNEALKSPNVECVRQATRTIANLTVNPINKERAQMLLDTLLELSNNSGAHAQFLIAFANSAVPFDSVG